MTVLHFVQCYLVCSLYVVPGRALLALVHPENDTSPTSLHKSGLPNWIGTQYTQWYKHLRTPLKAGPSSKTYAVDEPMGLVTELNPSKIKVYRGCRFEPALVSFFNNLDKKGGLNITALETAFDNNDFLVLIPIRNNKVQECEFHSTDSVRTETTKKRITPYLNIISRVLAEIQLPDMDLVFSVDDETQGPPGVFRVSGKVGSDLLFIPRSLTDLGAHLREAQQIQALWPICSERKPAAVFRGTTTGSGIHLQDVLQDRFPGTPRFKTVDISMKFPNIVDAGFVGVVQAYGDEKQVYEILKQRGMIKQWLTDEQQRCYAAVVVIDGNAVPDRLPTQLAYGIPVIFVHELDDEFWYSELRPGVDFVVSTPENLIMTLEKLFADADYAKTIGYNGKKYVETYLTENRLMCYAREALYQYGERWKKAKMG